MARVVTLGEIMLRLSPSGHERFVQAKSFDVNYGGGEANVAASLANFGHNVYYVTKVPDNEMGESAISFLRKFNVDCKYIVKGGRRLGIYYLENGASVRPSNVIYDRQESAFSEADYREFDFESIFKDIDLFHVSGITPVLSENCAKITLEALKYAKKNNIVVSFDLNYREKLWREGVKEKQKLISNMMQYTDICFGNARDAAKVLGYRDDKIDFINCDYSICINQENMKKVLNKYEFKYFVTTKRNSLSASDNIFSAIVCSKENYYQGMEYKLHIVDRVGGGDALVAGFLHGILSNNTAQDSLEFAIAASAIKHTIPGDINLAKIDEVVNLVSGNGAARIQR